MRNERKRRQVESLSQEVALMEKPTHRPKEMTQSSNVSRLALIMFCSQLAHKLLRGSEERNKLARRPQDDWAIRP
ncbi:hypothetical protein Pcinc_005275 [Petrolisthes cinctipes]|uniref:Uncharacterized protein n=1 Tax=Petrolisthes cinctipes TaxID=88211 RepID=A0AAE1GCZ1_PETCI|nr:hypothetical protein Pcinc_005275 [Petrolisthes cinctipes]